MIIHYVFSQSTPLQGPFKIRHVVLSFICKGELFCESSFGHHVFAGHRQMSAKSVTADPADPSVIMSNDPAVTVHGINPSKPPTCPNEPCKSRLHFQLSFVGTSSCLSGDHAACFIPI